MNNFNKENILNLIIEQVLNKNINKFQKLCGYKNVCHHDGHIANWVFRVTKELNDSEIKIFKTIIKEIMYKSCINMLDNFNNLNLKIIYNNIENKKVSNIYEIFYDIIINTNKKLNLDNYISITHIFNNNFDINETEINIKNKISNFYKDNLYFHMITKLINNNNNLSNKFFENYKKIDIFNNFDEFQLKNLKFLIIVFIKIINVDLFNIFKNSNLKLVYYENNIIKNKYEISINYIKNELIKQLD